MDMTSLVVLLLAVFVGSYIQSVIGFAMGMIVVAIGSISGTISYSELTAAVSLITLVNIVVALKDQLHEVSKPFLGWLVLGQLPAIALGLLFLSHLTLASLAILELLLGLFLLFGSIAMVYRPRAKENISTPLFITLAGMAAGLTGGLFAASGPVMGWFGYRQPMLLVNIRATLLTFFAIACVSRTVMVAYMGNLTPTVLHLFLLAIPVSAGGAWLGVIAKPKLSDSSLKRYVFIGLIFMALYLCGRALFAIR